VDVERVERVADLVSDARGEESEGLDAFAFDGLKGFLPGFGRVVEDESEAGSAYGVAVERCGVQAEEARAREGDFEFVADHALAAFGVHAEKLLPVQFGKKVPDVAALSFAGFDAEELGDGLV
jgi:hypothetical protein